MTPITAQFVDKFEPLFQPWRYKVYWGGRAAGRSWGFARALLIIGAGEKKRVLCARELQNSITESVHRVLSDQIELLGLGDKDGNPGYVIQRDRIFHRTSGSEFFFEGIKNNTTKIKSYEAVDICWVEEANKVSQTSWDILIPTIRRTGSEIWMTFNPDLERDYTYRRFVLNPPPNAVVVKMSYKDNPWLSPEMLGEIEDLRERDMDAYLNVWEGNPRQMLEGVVYAKELRKAEAEGRITAVGWARETAVDTFWDLGKRDHTSIWFAQRVSMEYRVLHYYESTGEDILHYLKYCDSQPYVLGTFYLPHDAKHARLGSRRTIEEMIRDGGKRSVRVLPRTSVMDGINAGRILFPQLWFDRKGCDQGLRRLRGYRYRVDEDGHYSESPLHDENSDAADAYRTMAMSLRNKDGPSGVVEKLLAVAEAASEWVPFLGDRGGQEKTSWMGY